MKQLKRTPIFLIFVLMLSSCMKHVDFDQIEDFSTRPVIETSLVYFTLDQVNFFDVVNSVEIETPIDDTSGFTLLKNKFVRENLVKAELDIQVNNQFDRRFTVLITFLDDNNFVTHEFDPIIVSENNPNFKHQVDLSIAKNTRFLSSTKLKVSVELSASSDGSIIDPNVVQKLVFTSSGTFYLKS